MRRVAFQSPLLTLIGERSSLDCQLLPVGIGARWDARPFAHWAAFASVEPGGDSGSHELIDPLARQLHNQRVSDERRKDPVTDPEAGIRSEAGSVGDIGVAKEPLR